MDGWMDGWDGMDRSVETEKNLPEIGNAVFHDEISQLQLRFRR